MYLDNYLNYLCENLKQKGIIMFDSRKTKNIHSIKKLKDVFKLVSKIDHGKFERITLINMPK